MRVLREQGLQWAAVLAASLGISACGGGSSGSSQLLQPTGPSQGTATAQMCAANNPYRGDAASPTKTGTLADEKAWMKKLFQGEYLWRSEMGTPDPTAAAYSDENDIYTSLANYFEALKTKQTTPSGALRDRFSFLYPTAAYEALMNRGSAGGYGAEWLYNDPASGDPIRVAYVQPGTAADRAGLRRGDVLISADGIDARAADATSINEVLNDLYPNDTAARSFVFDRNGTRTTVSLTPAQVTMSAVSVSTALSTPQGTVGYMAFHSHTAASEGELITAINLLKAQNVSDLVLDLRYNGGGYLYIASQLAYMIAGSARTQNKVFERLVYVPGEPTRPADSEALSFQSQECRMTAQYTCASSAPLPALNLARVFVLTTENTCSASESVINSLRGIGVDVVALGSATCGKPYGFRATDNCGISYFPISFRSVNNAGFGGYAEGMAPQCAAADDLSHELGDRSEGLLTAALTRIRTGACPAAAERGVVNGIAGRILGNPVLRNRLLVPSQPR